LDESFGLVGYPILFTEHTRLAASAVSGMVQGKFQKLVLRLICSSTTWGIWLLMNKIIFKEGTTNLFDCFFTILY
jgi:hypothetical protein